MILLCVKYHMYSTCNQNVRLARDELQLYMYCVSGTVSKDLACGLKRQTVVNKL